MKKKYLLFLIPILCGLSSCSFHTGDAEVNRNPSQGIPVKETKNIKFIKSAAAINPEIGYKPEIGRLYVYRIKDQAVIQDIPCIG